jgi:uncharacterized protein (UPF0335 family)
MSCTETIYIESADSMIERVERLEQIIEALEIRALAVVGDADVEEYQIDDGQVKIRTLYKSSESIAKAIMAYEKLRNKLLNKLNGRNMALRPWQGIR